MSRSPFQGKDDARAVRRSKGMKNAGWMRRMKIENGFVVYSFKWNSAYVIWFYSFVLQGISNINKVILIKY